MGSKEGTYPPPRSEMHWMQKTKLPLLEKASMETCPSEDARFHLKRETEGQSERTVIPERTAWSKEARRRFQRCGVLCLHGAAASGGLRIRMVTRVDRKLGSDGITPESQSCLSLKTLAQQGGLG